MSQLIKISIKTVMKDSGYTPAMLLVKINSIAEKQLLNDIKGRSFTDKAKKEYVENNLALYKMSRATLYNIIRDNKASRRKSILIKKTLFQIIKEQNLYSGEEYKNTEIEIFIDEYDR